MGLAWSATTLVRVASPAGLRPAVPTRGRRSKPVRHLLRELEDGRLAPQLEHEDIRVHEHPVRIEGRDDLKRG